MARFVLTSRRAGHRRDEERHQARAGVAQLLGRIAERVRVIGHHAPDHPTARHTVVFDVHPDEVGRHIGELPRGVLVEREILHHYDTLVPTEFVAPKGARRPHLRLPGSGRKLRVEVRGRGRPLAGAMVLGFLRGSGEVSRAQGVTSSSGATTLHFDAGSTPAAIVVAPAGNYWPMVVLNPSGTRVRVDVPPLPMQGPLGWWHGALGVRRHRKTRGKGLRVGVADTGCGPHACLDHVHDAGSFLDARFSADGVDAAQHGTHVCGIIGARPRKAAQYAGVAAGADLVSARVFRDEGVASQADVAHGIDLLTEQHGADLVNLSLGADEASDVLHDAILDAEERGVLCVCAAANSAAAVEWPGAFAETVAVSALGMLGWGPPGSVPAMRVPQEHEKHGEGGYFLGSFSCFGPDLDCAGPGVGILSTVPERHGLRAPYGSMTGTSMASPAVCGALAAVLAEDEEYRAMPRAKARAERARAALVGICRSVGLDRDYEGHGIPRLEG